MTTNQALVSMVIGPQGYFYLFIGNFKRFPLLYPGLAFGRLGWIPHSSPGLEKENRLRNVRIDSCSVAER